MNTLMWTHPSTSQALSNLEAWGYQGECLNGLDGYNLTYSSYIYVFLSFLFSLLACYMHREMRQLD
jgi:hypothetical protein